MPARTPSGAPGARRLVAADPPLIIGLLDVVPPTAYMGLKPAAEIHRQNYGHAAGSHVAGGIACRNIHAAKKRDREMAEITADAASVIVAIESGLLVVREMITKSDVLMHPIANRLGACPTGRRRAEEFPRDVGKLVDLAIAAG